MTTNHGGRKLRNRKRAEMKARALGYFWLPCPLCGEEFAGQEWKLGPNGEAASVPAPGDPHSGTAICPSCTAEGKGDAAWAEIGVIRV